MSISRPPSVLDMLGAQMEAPVGSTSAIGGRIGAKLRHVAYFGLSRRTAARGLLSGRPPDAEPAAAADRIVLAPAVRDSRELSDLAARVNWYLPDAAVPIHVQAPDSAIVAPDCAPWMDPALVRDPGWHAAGPARSNDHVLVHRVRPREVATVLGRGRASTLAAPDFYAVADLGWFWLRWQFASMASQASPAALERLAALGGPDASAFVLATGPSARQVDAAAVTADIRISCNSVVRDQDLLRALRPNVLCFGDPAFHFGPSRYAAAFREDLLRAVDLIDPLLVTIEPWAGVLLAHHPELAERLIILRVQKSRRGWRWPGDGNFAVRMTGNVLTCIMLPMAFALAKEIEIAGCDGRQPNETYFWRHNARTQYSDELMRSAFEAHPAFFRDSNYADYYARHCRDLDEFLAAAEEAGKEVRGVTPSYIPALRRRGAAEPARA